jgi:predicted AAA+ superfamily ATPase
MVHNSFEIQSQLEERLIFGSYPELWDYESYRDKQKYLQTIRSSYLYKDILMLADVKHSSKLEDLLKLLAFQIGCEVSLSELARSLQISKETVDRYINLLEKSFIIFRRKGFSRNLRKEVTKMDKIYFFDLGIRNVLIDNLKPIKERDDLGNLWENFLMAERHKYMTYTDQLFSPYFWRIYTGAEIDYVEERDGKLTGYEFKFQRKGTKPTATFLEQYPGSQFSEISRDNYLEFIT